MHIFYTNILFDQLKLLFVLSISMILCFHQKIAILCEIKVSRPQRNTTMTYFFIRHWFNLIDPLPSEAHMHMLWNTSPTCTCRSRKELLTPFSPGEEETFFRTDRTKKKQETLRLGCEQFHPSLVPSCFFMVKRRPTRVDSMLF